MTSPATLITGKDAIRENHKGHNFPHINPKSIKPRKLKITLLSMRRSSGWSPPPAAVMEAGEVAHPGGSKSLQASFKQPEETYIKHLQSSGTLVIKEHAFHGSEADQKS